MSCATEVLKKTSFRAVWRENDGRSADGMLDGQCQRVEIPAHSGILEQSHWTVRLINLISFMSHFHYCATYLTPKSVVHTAPHEKGIKKSTQNWLTCSSVWLELVAGLTNTDTVQTLAVGVGAGDTATTGTSRFPVGSRWGTIYQATALRKISRQWKYKEEHMLR